MAVAGLRGGARRRAACRPFQSWVECAKGSGGDADAHRGAERAGRPGRVDGDVDRRRSEGSARGRGTAVVLRAPGLHRWLQGRAAKPRERLARLRRQRRRGIVAAVEFTCAGVRAKFPARRGRAWGSTSSGTLLVRWQRRCAGWPMLGCGRVAWPRRRRASALWSKERRRARVWWWRLWMEGGRRGSRGV